MAENQTAANGSVNNANVSTTRGVKGGYAFCAPVGTTIPTDITTPLDPAFKCAGYIGEDGFEEGVDGSSESIVDMNGDPVDEYSESMKETIGVTFIEMGTESLSVQYGQDNVAERDGMIIVDHNWSKAEEVLVWVFELVLKNNRRWRKVIPQGKATERDTFTGNSTTVAGRKVTFSYLTDENGSGCKDYIEVTPGSAKKALEDASGAPDSSEDVTEGNDEPSTPALDDMTVQELKDYASTHGIDISGKTTKADILEAIKNADGQIGAE